MVNKEQWLLDGMLRYMKQEIELEENEMDNFIQVFTNITTEWRCHELMKIKPWTPVYRFNKGKEENIQDAEGKVIEFPHYTAEKIVKILNRKKLPNREQRKYLEENGVNYEKYVLGNQ